MEKGEFFATQDRYIYDPFEEAMFFWDHTARTVRMRFTSWSYDVPVETNHRIFNEAIRGGWEITQAEYEAGVVNPR